MSDGDDPPVSQTQVAAQLGISLSALWSLSGNPGFPTPLSNDDAGNVTWSNVSVNAFQALMVAAAANGWSWQTEDLPSCNFTMMASTVCGQYRRTPFFGAGGSGGLFD
jgi:hypothetical protein